MAREPSFPGSVPFSPVHWPLRVQELEDGLPIHVCRDVQSGDVQDGGGQVDVEDDVGDPEGQGVWKLGHLDGSLAQDRGSWRWRSVPAGLSFIHQGAELTK